MQSTSREGEDWPRVAPTRRLANEWALVLIAEGLSPTVAREGGAFLLRVPAREEERAAQILAAYARENRAPEPPPAEPVVSGQLLAGVAASIGLLAFFLVTGPWSEEAIWFERGSADSRRILLGEIWRSVTALTLHADLAHVMANAIAGALFVTAVCRSWGQGLGCALVLASGAGGNLLNAWLRSAPHVSVGASTAVFGAVGILGGVGLVRRRRRGARGRRSWAPVAAALALLAMLGTAGERVDFGAHLFGLLVGGVLGSLAALAFSRPPGALVQWSLATAAIASILACWALALPIREQEPTSPGIERDRGSMGTGQSSSGPNRGPLAPGAQAVPLSVAFAPEEIPVGTRGSFRDVQEFQWPRARQISHNQLVSFVKLSRRGASFDRRKELGAFPSLRVSNRVCLSHLARLARAPASSRAEQGNCQFRMESHGWMVQPGFRRFSRSGKAPLRSRGEKPN